MKKFLLKTVLGMHDTLTAIHLRSLEIMSTLDDVKAATQAIRDAAVAEKQQVQEKLDAVSAQIADLAAQVAAGISPTQLDSVVADLNQAASDVANIFTPDTPATPAPADATPPADAAPAAETAPAEAPADAPLAPAEEVQPQPLLP